MAELTAGFGTGVDGNTVAISDPGNATAWDVVNIGGGGESITYDNSPAIGALSAHFLTTGGGGTAHLQWTTAFGTQTEYYGRACLYRTANPASSITHVRHPRTGGTGQSWDVNINSSGKTVILDQAAGTLATSTASIPLNAWFRVEWHLNHSTGFIEVLLFSDAFSTTLTETVISASGQNIAADADKVDFGIQALSEEVWYDELVDKATSYPGAVGTKVAWIKA